ncbi:ribonuclease P/MRP protein subunit Pop5p [Trichomonascus vanleenenianus]|uniref:RNA-binding protein POP5 n=1 Tax=Trichomonascus vanleenenianus TaxID=2268995 RepID=UPI003ECAA7E3
MVRLKTRYLLFQILYPNEIDNNAKFSENIVKIKRPSSPELDGRRVLKLIKQSIEYHFGDYGMGVVASTIAVKYFSPATSTGIIRVTRAHYKLVWAALTYIDNVLGEDCIIQVVQVSGTIKKCEQAAIARNKQSIETALLRFEDNVEELEDQ